MASAVTITGLDDCLQCLDRAPENLLKMTRDAMKDAGKKTAADIRKVTPARFRKLIRSKVIKMQSGETNALVGLFNGHQQRGHQNKGKAIDDWFKAYWMNYGTLAGRDSSHTFDNPIKRSSQRRGKNGQLVNVRRNNVGQRAVKFFDAENGGYEDRFLAEFEASLKRQEEKLYER